MSIPDRAIESGSRAMFASEQCDLRQRQDLEANWLGRLSDHDRNEYRRLTTAALTAAAPFIAYQSLIQAAEAILHETPTARSWASAWIQYHARTVGIEGASA